MNRRTQADAEQDVRPHLADDLFDVAPAGFKALDPAEIQPDGRIDVAGLNLLHPVLQMAFHLQLADHEAGNDRHQQAKAQVHRRDFPAEHAEQQDQRDLINHRRSNQEGEGHAERHSGREEADEQRHGRARTERRDDAERRGQYVADADTFAR